jgi:O-antigen/teichoic acid export membrane protein
MGEVGCDVPKTENLGISARASLLWGGGFTILRDVAQFGTMLVLVRLLSPSDYGSAALAQTIIGFLSVFSFGTLVLHALQLRDPSQIDWQAHFTAAVVVNTMLCAVTVCVAWFLSLSPHYANAAMPLAVLSLVFIVEIPGSLRHRMVQVDHDWKRFRLLLLIGSLLALLAGLVIAWAGGGVWALVVQPMLYGVPAAIDLVINARWRPDWTWSWTRYRDIARFGFTRMGSAILFNARQLTEQAVFTGVYNFATLGIFTRSVGLATLATGRIGSVAMGSLYPIITRAERGSEQFRRYSDLTLRGVTWMTVPAAAYLAVSAHDMVNLLYGAKWGSVIPLLPLAVASVGLGGIAAAANNLLLANDQIRTCLTLDLIFAGLGIGLALWLVPAGPSTYLAALIAANSLMLGVTLAVLTATQGISTKAVLTALLPAAIASLAGVGVVFGLRTVFGANDYIVARLLIDGVVFSIGYLAVMRIAFLGPLRELLEVAPGGATIAAGLFIRSWANDAGDI